MLIIKKKLLLKTVPTSRPECTNLTLAYFRQNSLKTIHTYLSSLYKGVPLGLESYWRWPTENLWRPCGGGVWGCAKYRRCSFGKFKRTAISSPQGREVRSYKFHWNNAHTVFTISIQLRSVRKCIVSEWKHPAFSNYFKRADWLTIGVG